jgi:hypothetical protein
MAEFPSEVAPKTPTGAFGFVPLMDTGHLAKTMRNPMGKNVKKWISKSSKQSARPKLYNLKW